jgi:hypothetical protein
MDSVEKALFIEDNAAVVVTAQESYVDENKQQRNIGDKWLITGPTYNIC